MELTTASVTIFGLMAAIIGAGIYYYAWKKYKYKDAVKYLLACVAFAIILIWPYFAEYILHFRGQVAKVNYYFFKVLIAIDVVFFIWIYFKDFFRKEKDEEWIDYLKKMLVGFDYVNIGIVIEHDGKFLLLGRNNVQPNEDFLQFPQSDEINGNSEAFEIAQKTLRRTTGLVLVKMEKSLGTLDGASNSGEKIRALNYLCKVKPGEIKLNKKRYKAYYWISPNDEKFKGLPEPIQNILLNAQDYLRNNPQEK